MYLSLSPLHGIVVVLRTIISRLILSAILLATTLSLCGQDFISNKSEDNYPPSLLEKANELYLEKKYDLALKEVDRVFNNLDTSQNLRTYIAALELKFHSYRRQEGIGYEGAFPLISEAYVLAKKHLELNDLLLARVYKTYGTFFFRYEDFFTSKALFDTAIVLYNSSDYFDQELYNTIINYKYYAYSYSNGNTDTLLKYVGLRQEFEESKSKPDPVEILYIMQDYPDMYITNGDYERAITSAIQGYKYALENKEKVLIKNDVFDANFEVYANSYMNLIEVMLAKREYDEAIKIGSSLLDLIEEERVNPENYIEYPSLMLSLGKSHANLGNFEEALNYYQKALLIGTETSENARFYSRVLFSIGECYLGLKELDKSLKFYEKGLQLYKANIIMPSTSLHGPYSLIGEYFEEINEYKGALLNYDSALINSMPNNSKSWTEFPNDTSLVLSIDQIKTISRKVSAMKRIDLDSIPRKELLQSVIENCSQLHDVLVARRQEFSAAEGKLFLSSEFRFVYETAIEAAYLLNQITGNDEYIFEALKFSRLSKSVLFLEQSAEYEKVNNNYISSELKNEFNDKIKELHYIESGFYKLLDDDVRSDSIVQLNERLVLARQQFKGVIDTIDYELSTIQKQGLMTSLMSELTKVDVAENELLIEYFYGQEFIYILSFDKKQQGIYKLPINSDFDESLLSVLKIISNQPEIKTFEETQIEFSKNSHFIYTKLVEPVIEKHGNKELLTIIPDDILSRLPFEVLINELEEGWGYDQMPYLLNEYQIRYQLSSLIQSRSYKSRNAEGILGLGFANRSVDNFDGLPGTEREINALKASYPGTFINAASKSDFLELSKNYDILHLAVHGRVDSLDKYNAELIFSTGDQNRLKTTDLYLASPNARLAVLSACESGVGVINEGEGSFSIARGFAIAGLPSIVMSLWQVNDNITSDLMESMYEGFINNSNTINQSLQQAKLNYLATADSYLAHPFYWASFVHLGENIKFKKGINDYGQITYLLGSIFLCFLLIFGYKKRKRTY